MRQRGRPRRSSMPAVTHSSKLLDCPYSRQPQSPPTEHYQMQHYYDNGGPESGGDAGDEDNSHQQLSERYSRIQLVDQWPHQQQQQMGGGGGGGGAHFGTGTTMTTSTTTHTIVHQQHYFQAEGPLPTQHQMTTNDQLHNNNNNYPNYSQIIVDDDQQSQDDIDDDDEEEEEEEEEEEDEEEFAGPSDSKRKRAYSFSSAPSSSTTNTVTTSSNTSGQGGPTAEKRPATKICRVCGDRAYSYNFNVITCESCKAFFRRNANKEKEIRCPFNEQCEITILSRRFCQRCRLQKCFDVGMKKEWIMSEEARLEKKQRIQENRERRAAAAAFVEVVGQQQTNNEIDQFVAATQSTTAQQPHFKEEMMPIPSNIPLPMTSLLHQQPQQIPQPDHHPHQQQHEQPMQTENLPGVLLVGQSSGPAPSHPHPLVVDPLVGMTHHHHHHHSVLSNPFVQQQSASATTAAAAAAAVNAVAANNEQQAIAVAQVAAAAQVAVAAQACAVQHAVNQAAAVVLLHHHQQQQQQNQSNADFIDLQLQQQQIIPQHEPSPQQQSLQSAEDSAFQPSIVGGIPIAASSTTSIHTTMANGGGIDLAPAQQPAPNLSGFMVASAAAENQSQQIEPMQIATIGGIQSQPQLPPLHPHHGPVGISSSAAAATGFVPGIGQVPAPPIMMTTSTTESVASGAVLTPAAAVAAAFIQQQQQQQQNSHQNHQIMAPVASTNGPSTLTPQQSATAASIQQQFASQVAAQQAHHQLVEQQQQAAQQAAAAVAQLQQQAQVQAQQQAAQIVAHAQQIQMVQQQQLAALANAAAVHHQQQQQQNPASTAATLLVGPGQNTAVTIPTEAVNHQLQQVANALSTGSLTSSTNGSPGAVGASAGILPTFMEVAAQLAAQPSSAQVVGQSNAPSMAATILPALIPASAQTSAANMLLQQQQQHQSHQMGLSSGQQQQQSGTPPQTGQLPGAPQTSQVQFAQLASGQMAVAQQQQQQQIHQPTPQQQQQRQEMVSIPKDVLMKLVEQRLEAERTHLQTPSKCQCHCQCGRYPNDMFIVDKVMADLLESSAKHLNNNCDNNSSNNSTPRLSQQFQPLHFQSINNGQGQSHNQPTQPPPTAHQQLMNLNVAAPPAAPQPSQMTIPIEAMDTSTSQNQLSQADQEQLGELAKANEVWKNSAPAQNGPPNMLELQFLMGHYTESDLRRLIGVAKTLDAFKRLDQPDQERLLQGSFGGFFVLRSILTSSHPSYEYNWAMMRQSGVSESIVRFYEDFPAEWRQNETVNLLLGMILLFNVEVAGLQSAISVTVENMKFQSLLRRLLFILCDRDSARADGAAAELMARIEQLKQLFPAINSSSQPAAVGSGNSLAFGGQPPAAGQMLHNSQIDVTGGLVSSS